MTRIAFFGHDAADSAIRRRVRAFQDDGLDVTGFMMRRRDDVVPDWSNIDLGLTRDGDFAQRIQRVFTGARTAANAHAELEAADVIYARNLDMLACAFLAKRYARLDTPVIYECLDVHRLLTRADPVGKFLRLIEGRLLRRTAGLVVSSPGFLKNHFDIHFEGKFTPYLVENRLAAGANYGPRPTPDETRYAGGPGKRKLRLGWVGILRCQRSLDLLCGLADAFPDTLEIRLHGLPARNEIRVFEPEIEKRANMTYFGRYQSPEDLSEIYGNLDVVWAGDFMEAGYNSVWLLPNRIYEGGYYATPSIAPSETETAAWIERHACGFTVDEPLVRSLPEIVERLYEGPAEIDSRARALLKLPEDTFIQPHGMLATLINKVLQANG